AVVIAVVGGLVSAGAEGAVAGAGEHDRADRAVVAGAVEGADQLVAGLATERVHLVRPIDRDPGDRVADLVEDVRVSVAAVGHELLLVSCLLKGRPRGAGAARSVAWVIRPWSGRPRR